MSGRVAVRGRPHRRSPPWSSHEHQPCSARSRGVGYSDTADTHNGSPAPALPVLFDSTPNSARSSDRRDPEGRDRHPRCVAVRLIVYALLGLAADFVVRSFERLMPQWRPMFTGRWPGRRPTRPPRPPPPPPPTSPRPCPHSHICRLRALRRAHRGTHPLLRRPCRPRRSPTRRPAGRVRGPARPQRLRQVHPVAGPRRARPPQRGHGTGATPQGRRLPGTTLDTVEEGVAERPARSAGKTRTLPRRVEIHRSLRAEVGLVRGDAREAGRSAPPPRLVEA